VLAYASDYRARARILHGWEIKKKLLKNGVIDAVKDCESCFAIDLPSCVLRRKQDKFILRYISTVNVFFPIQQQAVILN